jgi:hypothetical protein
MFGRRGRSGCLSNECSACCSTFRFCKLHERGRWSVAFGRKYIDILGPVLGAYRVQRILFTCGGCQSGRRKSDGHSLYIYILMPCARCKFIVIAKEPGASVARPCGSYVFLLVIVQVEFRWKEGVHMQADRKQGAALRVADHKATCNVKMWAQARSPRPSATLDKVTRHKKLQRQLLFASLGLLKCRWPPSDLTYVANRCPVETEEFQISPK